MKLIKMLKNRKKELYLQTLWEKPVDLAEIWAVLLTILK